MGIHYNDWTIVRKIGSGSFGTVYEIERESFGFRQKAALKVISIPQSQNDVAAIRNTGMDEASISDYYRDLASEIMKELQTMEQLKGHTNIVSYEDHEIRPKEEGIGWDIFIRMELLTPLTNYLSERQMSRGEIIRLGIDLCRALERCESLNIIHRDIKPDNIFLSRQGDGKLGDFGIARTVERTMSGMSKKGTYSFMAPEVYMGQPYGRTVDIYSLGLVLYRLLNYNRGPFLPAYPNPIKFQDQERSIVRRIKGELLPAPAQADEGLAEVVLKACSFDASQRYSTAEEMRFALQALMGEDSAVIPAPDVPSEQDPLRTDAHQPGPVSDDGLDERTVSGFTPQQEDDPAEARQLQNENTVSAFRGQSENPLDTASVDSTMGLDTNRELVNDATVSVFGGDSGLNEARGTELVDDATVSIFGKTKQKDASEEIVQKKSTKPEAEPGNYRFRENREDSIQQKKQQEEEERAKRERAAKKKKRNIIIAVAAVMIGVIVAVTALNTASKTNSAPVSTVEQNETIEDKNQQAKDDKKERVNIFVPFRTTELLDREKTTITISVDSNNTNYILMVDYPRNLLQVGQESVTHTDSGRDVYNYNVTPKLPAGVLKQGADLVIRAVSTDGKRTEYAKKLIHISITAPEDAVVLRDYTGDIYDDAYTRLRRQGLKPKIRFSEYKNGKTRRIASQKPKAPATLHKGDTVTLIVNGWARDDVSLKTEDRKLKLKKGKKKKVIIKASGNLPDNYWLNLSYYSSLISCDWGEWIDENSCELYVTAKEPLDHETILVVLKPDEDGKEDPLAGMIIEVNTPE